MEAEKANVPIALMGRVLEVSRSGYYAWRNREPCARSQTDGKLKVNIGAIHERSRGTYGVPRVHAELEASGVAMAECVKVSETVILNNLCSNGLLWVAQDEGSFDWHHLFYDRC